MCVDFILTRKENSDMIPLPKLKCINSFNTRHKTLIKEYYSKFNPFPILLNVVNIYKIKITFV